ncbi:bifunctional demethylmenaquinone methyltransferase/2-methoxy-6-polyprenyl-1,4-benzoquinol methylase UbiE [Haliscomenobacter hydrossis]|uniref:Demethylmenaquinone methyltransferase n=1 Tax=Haliscomenobacter hydrossis (strain ATCC 27775 / DSM 1100 / LMG 10767 / O) TaxID=760192 RepID=F4L7F3_HALH1|nr:bifunctional demethylmenaquinone methyltransferase/2-methoxy-6-polyprenyl-1,4-benzoquinol methylase UbiE [Haliscomenobacter hydrossis]AEE54133.1 Ubiquinone/menaquinone biosynthesis methyltransferase ubiE [Haliscomenobacter hydrossis DSM 1100]
MGQITPYNEQESKTRQVSRMFDRIAPYYDFLNHFLSLGIDRGWRRKAIAEVAQDQPQRILDIATGTADLAIAMAEKLQPQEIIGVDIAPKMLEIGRVKVRDKGLNKIVHLEDGDSQELRFPDNQFDVVTAAFGVRNFEDLGKGLSEMYRVLKPGGKIVVLEFSRPKLFPFKQIFNAYFKYLLPLIGRFTSNDQRAYAYLYESVQVFPEGQELVNIFEKTGFKSNRCTALTLGVCSIYVGFK